MWKPSPSLEDRLRLYCQMNGIAIPDLMLGGGKDGGVWMTSRTTALKLHERSESYRHERNAYLRLRDVGLTTIEGFNLPQLENYDDDLWAIEMTAVTPPFVVDFASARIDLEPDFI